MADYISQFTGSEIDQRLAKVPQVEAALAGKQATLVSGTNIKTINGQSVLGSGDMTIQAGDTDAVKYVAQTLTDAQKAQARANIDAASLADIADFDFVTVTSLPTASASTMGHIYLVGPDANDNYDRYYTQQSGSTYSWVALGSTEIDLSGYATQAELNQLEAKVDALNTEEIVLADTDLRNYSILTTGKYGTSTSYKHKAIPVNVGEKYLIVASGSAGGRYAFFANTSAPSSGGNLPLVDGTSVNDMVSGSWEIVTIPSGCVALAFQWGQSPDYTFKPSLYKKIPVTNLEEEIERIEAEIDGYEGEELTAETLTADKYYNTNSSTIPASASSKTDCYCARVAVTPGEKYRVSGLLNSGTATRLWATADSESGRLRYQTTGSIRTTIDITIEPGEAYLVVNLVDYDSTKDGFWKITPVHIKGLEERVTDLEEIPAVNVIDSLDSESTTDPLSANQGRVLNEEINGVTTPTYTDQEIIPDKYFNTTNSRVPDINSLSDATTTSCVYVFVSPGDVFRIYGKGDASVRQLYALADSDRYVVQDGTPGVAMNTRTNPLILTIPNGVSRLIVNLYQYDSATDKVQKVGAVTSESIKTRLDALENEKQLALPLMGKKIMFFGDSITDYTYNQKGLVNYFAEASLASCYKAAIGGTRFVQRTTPVDTPTSSTEAYAALDICNMVKAWCEADYTKQDAATAYLGDNSARVNALKNNPIAGVDIVCIGGGTNDMTSSSPIGNDSDNDFNTIKGSINKIVELLLTANPKLKIYFYSPVVGYHGSGGRIDANWDDNHQFSSGLTKPEYIDIFAERAKKNHIPYINLYWTLGWNQVNFSNYFLDTDDHHPYKGFDVIGRRLYQQVVTNLE